MTHYLEVKSLSYAREARFLWQRVHFQVNTGEVLQILGVNGVGKSTLLKLIAGLLTPTEGEIWWRGERLSDFYPEFYREALFVGHKLGLKADLTVLENLHATLRARAQHQDADIRSALRCFDIESCAEKRLWELSAGQLQKVGLTRLLLEPAVLWLLDEPLANLDARGIFQLQHVIANHCRRGGAAVLSTHQRLEGVHLPLRSFDLVASTDHDHYV